MKKLTLVTLTMLFLLTLPLRAEINLLHEFVGGVNDGQYPWGSLIISGSTLYGMTQRAGDSDNGTVFKIEADGSGFTLLHSFVGGADDGAIPWGGSLLLSDSILYGMTYTGGVHGQGTIFKMRTDGTDFALLHAFDSDISDGFWPNGSLIISDSTLYGMTRMGGSSNNGTIFRIKTDGSDYILLHSFAGGTNDGANPQGDLILSGSTLYGMTYYGGDSSKGTIFKIETDGSVFALMHEFAGGVDDGAIPYGSLILSGSTLFGMTNDGGNSNQGVIFKIKTDSSGYTLLHKFATYNDGANPRGSLILSDSTLYGMTENGGSNYLGAIFKIQTDGSEFTLLHSFSNSANDGRYPYGLVTISGSTLYGMTMWGGVNDMGVIFSLELPSIINTAPNGGENWETLSNHDITWESTGNIANIKLEYSTDNGANWSIIAETTENDGLYNWDVANSPSENCLVRVSDVLGTANDSSDAVFTISSPPTITVTSPNGGESWEAGTAQNITWSFTGIIANVKLEYSTDSGSSWNTIIASTANGGSYNWTVANSPSSNCLVKVSDAAGTATDISNSIFTITTQRTITVTAPNGGESWEGGSAHNITWSSTGSIANVKLEYSTDSGSSWNTIIASTANGGSYNWTVANSPSSNCLVKVSDAAGTVADTSNATFMITAPRTITVTAPNGGESWRINTYQYILWNWTGAIDNVKIEYSTNNGSTWKIIASSSANTGSYRWRVTSPASTNCKVKVSSTTGSPSDSSNSVFRIRN